MYYAHLTRRARYQIAQLIQEAVPIRLIARKLAVHRSTIYRELKRGSDSPRQYVAAYAQAAAERRARRSAVNHPRKPASLWRAVARRLLRQWSPEQIRARARLLGQPFASVPAIYAWIARQRARGKRFHRHLRYAWRREQRLLNPWLAWRKATRPNIRQRPLEARDRRQPGHWEGDTLRGSSASNHHLLALVERTSRLLVLRRPSARLKLSESVAQHIARTLKGRLAARSITFDNGTEFARYEDIQRNVCPVFFADPRSPNQRATCENTIGLVRQYIPKGADLRNIWQRRLSWIENRLNNRPRKCLGYLTPLEVQFCKSPDVALRT
ncbi:MAG: IS30 family transposase [Woeseiaceae bacterium]